MKITDEASLEKKLEEEAGYWKNLAEDEEPPPELPTLQPTKGKTDAD